MKVRKAKVVNPSDTNEKPLKVRKIRKIRYPSHKYEKAVKSRSKYKFIYLFITFLINSIIKLKLNKQKRSK